MWIEKEVVEMPDPGLPIKTYIVDSSSRNLASDPHLHSEIELIYIVEGKMIFVFGEERIDVEAGKIIFINSLTVHFSESIPGVFTRMCLLQFNPCLIYNANIASEYKYLAPFIQQDTFKYYLLDTAQSEKNRLLASLLMEISTEFQGKNIAYEILIKSDLYKILTMLYRDNILKFNLLNNLQKEEMLFTKLSKVLDYVEKNYAENITVENISQMLDLNYSYFCRLFKTATGKPFVQYLNFLRVSVAEKLLLTTDKPITEIIAETGFSSLSYFNRTFKKARGCSPSQYRKN